MRRMPLICELWGSRRKSWGPHRASPDGVPILFLMPNASEVSLGGVGLGLLHHPSPSPPRKARAGGVGLILILLHQDNNNDKGETR